MVASEQKKRASQGKSHFLKYLTHVKLSNYEQSMVIKEALLYIAMLKLKIIALQREFEGIKIIKEDPLNQVQVSSIIFLFIIGEALLLHYIVISGENDTKSSFNHRKQVDLISFLARLLSSLRFSHGTLLGRLLYMVESPNISDKYYSYLLNRQEVKVDKIGERFQVNIKCLKGETNLVNILEAFEEMGLSVAQARASCLDSFVMEAIVAPQSKDKLCSVDDLIQALVKALFKPSDYSV